MSHPSRGAWIEITPMGLPKSAICGRTPHGVRGLKYPVPDGRPALDRSHPSRGAWIEIESKCGCRRRLPVAPLTGCVD